MAAVATFMAHQIVTIVVAVVTIVLFVTILIGVATNVVYCND